VAEKINKLVPGYMVMGDKGGSMGGMEMEIPENTLPMMTGTGPYGEIEMGGMFTLLKVRPDQKKGDYSDPGWYKAPKGTTAYEWTGELPPPVSAPNAAPPAGVKPVEVTRDKKGHDHH
jgi:manganese oxidase